MKKGINGLQMGLFDDLIKPKCSKNSWSLKALDHVLDTSDDALDTSDEGMPGLFEKYDFSSFSFLMPPRRSIMPPRQSIMPPRQPIMRKRTSYYAYRKKHEMEKNPNGSQMRPFDDLIKPKY